MKLQISMCTSLDPKLYNNLPCEMTDLNMRVFKRRDRQNIFKHCFIPFRILWIMQIQNRLIMFLLDY